MKEHCSWNDSKFSFEELQKLQTKLGYLVSTSFFSAKFVRRPQWKCTEDRSPFAEEYQHELIPVYNAAALDLYDVNVQRDIYATFFESSGVIIVKNLYPKSLMDRYNVWCEETLEKTKNDPNSRHPKQKHKFLINDLWTRMGETDPDMLLQLLADKRLNALQDVLLGFCKYGAATTHWIEPGGDRQRSHVATQAYKFESSILDLL